MTRTYCNATTNLETWLCWLKAIDPDTQEAVIIHRENGNHLYAINNKTPMDEANIQMNDGQDPLGNKLLAIAVTILSIFLGIYLISCL